MKVSGLGIAVMAAAGLMLMPATTDAAVFTLNTCVIGDCGSFSGSVTVTITDNVSDTNDVDFSIANNSNGVIDYMRFAYLSTPTGNGQITNFTAAPAGSVGTPSASFGSSSQNGYAYNVDLGFPNAAGSRFDDSEAVSFTLGSSSSFNFDANGFAPALAHIISLSIGGQSMEDHGRRRQQRGRRRTDGAGAGVAGPVRCGGARLRSQDAPQGLAGDSRLPSPSQSGAILRGGTGGAPPGHRLFLFVPPCARDSGLGTRDSGLGTRRGASHPNPAHAQVLEQEIGSSGKESVRNGRRGGDVGRERRWGAGPTR